MPKANHAERGRGKTGSRDKRTDTLVDLSDKENALRTANLQNYVGMSIVQESQQEDKNFRKRQSMLSEIQSMILDYKKKA